MLNLVSRKFKRINASKTHIYLVLLSRETYAAGNTNFFDRDSNSKICLLPGLEAWKVEKHWFKALVSWALFGMQYQDWFVLTFKNFFQNNPSRPFYASLSISLNLTYIWMKFTIVHLIAFRKLFFVKMIILLIFSLKTAKSYLNILKL